MRIYKVFTYEKGEICTFRRGQWESRGGIASRRLLFADESSVERKMRTPAGVEENCVFKGLGLHGVGI